MNGELLDKLDDPEAHYTVFAPTEDAFKDIDAETLDMWKKGEGRIDMNCSLYLAYIFNVFYILSRFRTVLWLCEA